MKNFKKFILLGIIIALLTPIYGFSREESDLSLMMGILEKVGASLEEGNITIGGVIVDEFIGEDHIYNIGKYIKGELGIQGDILITEEFENEMPTKENYLVQFSEGKGSNQLLIQGFDERENLITVNLSSYENEEDELKETSLFINLLNSEQFVENHDIILKAEKIFEEFDKPINVTSCIIGSINGNIDMNKKEKEILDATEKIEGKTVEEYKDEDIISLSIFTPLIEEYIFTGNKRMNLNIAMRYNEYENKTNIIIGTPIITIGY